MPNAQADALAYFTVATGARKIHRRAAKVKRTFAQLKQALFFRVHLRQGHSSTRRHPEIHAGKAASVACSPLSKPVLAISAALKACRSPMQVSRRDFKSSKRCVLTNQRGICTQACFTKPGPKPQAASPRPQTRKPATWPFWRCARSSKCLHLLASNNSAGLWSSSILRCSAMRSAANLVYAVAVRHVV